MKRCLIVPDALRELIRHLSPHLKISIIRALDEILVDPSTGKPLYEELEGLRTYKIGKFRIIYRVKDMEIALVAMGPRKTIYQKMLLEIKHRIHK